MEYTSKAILGPVGWMSFAPAEARNSGQRQPKARIREVLPMSQHKISERTNQTHRQTDSARKIITTIFLSLYLSFSGQVCFIAFNNIKLNK